MKKLLTFVLIVLLSNQTVLADCTACWALKYVRIELSNGMEFNGYIKWNRAWYSWFENPDVEIPRTFPEDMIYFYKQWENGTAEIVVYKKIYKIGENEEWSGYFLTNEDIVSITFDKIKTIRKVDNSIDNIAGAQELSIFSAKSLKIINREPNNIQKFEDAGCVYYLLNYNNQNNEKYFNEIVSKGFYNKEKELEENDIYVLKKCYD